MTTLDALPLLCAQITSVYETMSEFLPANVESEIEICDGRYCANLRYTDMGEGEISDLKFTFLKKYVSREWLRIGGIDEFNEELVEQIFKLLLKEHYEVKMREYKEKHAAEIAEAENAYFEDRYFDNRMSLALGK